MSAVPPGCEVIRLDTPRGPARVYLYRPSEAGTGGSARASVVLGHGAGGGIEAADLQAVAATLPGEGIEVALVEQPWRVAGRRVAPAPAALDAAWVAAVTTLLGMGVGQRRLVVGGRSAGARVACRTAAGLGADAVACLAFPLHPPGRPQRSRAVELVAASGVLPVLVVQGERDPFGGPRELRRAGVDSGCASGGPPVLTCHVRAVPWADHAFGVPARAPVTRGEALATVVAAVRHLVATTGRPAAAPAR